MEPRDWLHFFWPKFLGPKKPSGRMCTGAYGRCRLQRPPLARENEAFYRLIFDWGTTSFQNTHQGH